MDVGSFMMLAFVLFALGVVSNQLPDLQLLQWHNRVVLLFANDGEDKHLLEQKKAFEKVAGELQERDMMVFEILGKSDGARSLRGKFGVSNTDFSLVLIGKDGSSKLLRHKPVEPSELFHLVDNMPMRRDEIRQRQ